MSAPESSTLRVALVGAGPAALYAAAELATLDDRLVQVNLFDRLPTIGGLARAGVAPDHAERRRVIDAGLRQARRAGRLRFFGNVEIGTHLSHDELRQHHHAVIYAVGASGAQPLEVPGAQLPGCLDSSRFVGWYNGHPDCMDLAVPLDAERAVVIGNGNVALDVARMLLTDDSLLARSDIAAHAREALRRSAIRHVCVIGRRGPAQATFTHPELSELATLAGVQVSMDAAELRDVAWPEADFQSGLKRATLERYARSGGSTDPRKLELRFLRSPVEILGRDRVEGVRLVRNRLVADSAGRLRAEAGAEEEVLAAGLVVHAIGYRAAAVPGLPFDPIRAVVPNDGGRVLDPSGKEHLAGSYVVGWIKRGPRGVIGSNKTCARQTVQALAADARGGRLSPPVRAAGELEGLLRQRGCHVVDFHGWGRIDRHERAQALGEQPRLKLTRIDAMLRVAEARA